MAWKIIENLSLDSIYTRNKYASLYIEISQDITIPIPSNILLQNNSSNYGDVSKPIVLVDYSARNAYIIFKTFQAKHFCILVRHVFYNRDCVKTIEKIVAIISMSTSVWRHISPISNDIK